MNGFSSELEFRIAQRAYELFLLRGARLGQEVEDWLIAESEILGASPVSAEVAAEVSVEVPIVAEAEVAAVRATAAAKPKAKRAKSVATAAGATTPAAA